jgi:capsular exopolysaccharide synthesis family protein
LQTAWRHKWLIALGLAVGLVIAMLYSSQLSPEYQSSLKLLVIKKRPEGFPGSDPRNFMEDYLGTHQVVIRSPKLVGDAVKLGNLQSLPSFEKAGNPTAEIIGGLTVIRESTDGGSTSILNLSYRSAVAEDCPKVLTAVMDSYIKFLGDTYKSVNEETLKEITKAKTVLYESLSKNEAAYRTFRQKHPVLLRGKDGMSVGQERLYGYETKRSALIVRQAELQERVETFENGVKSGQDRKKLLALVAEPIFKLKGEKDGLLADLQLKEQAILEDFGPDHPQVRAIRKQIEALQVHVSTKSEDRPFDPVQAHLAELQRELLEINTTEKVLSNLLKREQDDAQKLNAYEIQDEAFRKDIAREQQLFESIVKRLQEMDLFKDSGGYNASVIAPAGPPAKVGPRMVPIFVLACLLGLAGGIGLAYLAEFTDRSFRSPEEIRRRLGLEIVGQIPLISTRGAENMPVGAERSSLAPILCAFHHPKSQNAEAYRGVRTGLFFSTQGKGHKVIQVTSPSAGDGKSTLAANLAASIAQAKKRVLLVDADFRRPTLHRIFGISADQGLASVLMGDAELAEVIQPSGIADLWILPCGPIPANPAELLSLPQFKEFLDHIREQYDFVIVDTPPMLAVTDPCMVVPHVDGVLLTLRPSKHAQPAAVRAKEVLVTLDATIIGVVLNGIDEKKSEYGYGGYGYGYESSKKYYQQPEPIEEPEKTK